MNWLAAVSLVSIAPIALALSLWAWEQSIRPRLIPARKLDTLVDLMLATFGPYAEHEAFLRQKNAWYRGDHLAQGVWMRIRRRLRRRWARGEIRLYDADEVAARRNRTFRRSAVSSALK